MSTTSWLAYGLTGLTSWLYRPSRPNAASSEVTARMRGTTAATAAPKAINRIPKVSGMVMTRDESRSSFTSAAMSSLARLLLRAWMRSAG